MMKNLGQSTSGSATIFQAPPTSMHQRSPSTLATINSAVRAPPAHSLQDGLLSMRLCLA